MLRIERVVAAALAGVVVSAAAAQEAVQWRVEDGGNGHWYLLRTSTDAADWESMVRIAQDLGGYLASVTSEGESVFLSNAVVQSRDSRRGALIGAFSQDPGANEWTWVSGERWGYTNWFNGDPSLTENLAYILNQDEPWPVGAWDDTLWGLQTDSAIIEWSADCNGDGIVDYGQILDGTFGDADGNGVLDCCDDASCTPATQWTKKQGGNGRWYQKMTINGTWASARILASARGAQLASVTSAEKAAMLNGLMLNWTWAYVGGLKVDGEWTWLNGDPWEYAVWVPGNPSEGTAETALELRITGDLNDIEPNEVYQSPYHAIIEWSSDCNGDGIVDYGQILDGTYPDKDVNGVPDCCEGACPGDLNLDDRVDSADIGLLIAAWNTDGSIVDGSDINGDGIVNAADLGLQIGNWGECRGCN